MSVQDQVIALLQTREALGLRRHPADIIDIKQRNRTAPERLDLTRNDQEMSKDTASKGRHSEDTAEEPGEDGSEDTSDICDGKYPMISNRSHQRSMLAIRLRRLAYGSAPVKVLSASNR